MEQRFLDTVAIAERAGYADIAKRLSQELETFKDDTYKIAVTGEFKTGKSTLINRIFLKEPVLFTDIMEATAVPTEIGYGPKKSLETISYPKYMEIEDEKDDIPFFLNDPKPEDIRQQTSADTDEERAKLAGKTRLVKLSWPADHLKGLTLYDTPGINSLNEAVIATTYRIIPKSDLVLFLTSAKQLSAVEIEFLSGRVFSEGITRAIVIIGYDPNAGILESRQRDELIKNIKNQLANIGRSQVPVELAMIRETVVPEKKESALTFIARLEAELSEPLETGPLSEEDHQHAVNDILSDLLGEKAKTEPKSENQDRKDEEDEKELSLFSLEEKLIRFIRENVRPARMEKAMRVLNVHIQLALVRCSAELGALGKSEKERHEMLDAIKSREKQIREKFDSMSEVFKKDLREIEIIFQKDIEEGLNRISKAFITGFNSCNGLGELQIRHNKADLLIKRDLEEMFLICSRKNQSRIKNLIEKYGIKSRLVLTPWQAEMAQDLSIDGGFLSRIPPFAIFTLDIMLFAQFGPFGPLADILIRLVASYIPYINKLMPVSIAEEVVKKKICKSVNEQFDAIKKDLPEQMDKTFRQISDRLIREWNSYANEQLNTVRESVEKAMEQTGDPAAHEDRRRLLAQVKSQLEEMV